MKSKENKPVLLKRKILSAVIKCFLVLVSLAVIAVTVFAVMFWDTFLVVLKNPGLIPYVFDNWDSLSRGLQVSTEEIEANDKENTEAQANAFANADINLTEDDITKLSDENLTEEERISIIYNAIATEENPDDVSVDNNISDTTDNNGDSDEKNVSDTSKENIADNSGNVNADSTKPDTAKQETGKPVDTKPGIVKPEQAKPNDTKPGNGKNEKTDPGNSVKPVTKPENPESSDDSALTEEQYNLRVSELVAKIYSIKSDFLGKLSAFESRIISEYKALPKEQRTSATKARIVSENTGYIMGLEAQCDAQVKSITDELTVLMKAQGKPTTLVEQINTAYATEKENKKAYYVSLYK